MDEKEFGERGIPYLNIASTRSATKALGPGIRAAIWVQGCPRRCKGCISPDWIPDIPALQITPEELADKLLGDPAIQGFSISGGEPMMQAAGLARLVHYARTKRKMDVICFTGFLYEKLADYPDGSGIHAFLDEIDVLIDGPYVEKLNDNLGLRGSSNQRIHHLTNRLKDHDLEHAPRKVELIIQDGRVISIGVPPREIPELLQAAFLSGQSLNHKNFNHDRERR